MVVVRMNDLPDSKIFNDEEVNKRILHIRTISLNTKNIKLGNSNVSKLISELKVHGWTMETRRQIRYFVETLDQRFSKIAEEVEKTFLDLLLDKERVASFVSNLQKKIDARDKIIEKRDERIVKLESSLEKKDQTITNLTNTLLNFESSKIIEMVKKSLEETHAKKSSKKGTKAEFSK
jgi:hypothetical protein